MYGVVNDIDQRADSLQAWSLPPDGYEGPRELTGETDPLKIIEQIGEMRLDENVEGGENKDKLVLGVHPG